MIQNVDLGGGGTEETRLPVSRLILCPRKPLNSIVSFMQTEVRIRRSENSQSGSFDWYKQGSENQIRKARQTLQHKATFKFRSAVFLTHTTLYLSSAQFNEQNVCIYTQRLKRM